MDLCKIDSDYCDTTSLDTDYEKRDLEDPYDDDDYDTHSIERRALPTFTAFHIRQWKIMMRALPWPSSGNLLKTKAGKEVLHKYFMYVASLTSSHAQSNQPYTDSIRQVRSFVVC